MKISKRWEAFVNQLRDIVELYDYAVGLENQADQLAGNFQKAFEQLQAANIKLQEYEAEKPKKKK